MSESIVLSLGSNLGDRWLNLHGAIEWLQKEGLALQRASSVYETEPWGLTEQPPFLNQVAQFRTSLTPRNLLSLVLVVEKRFGRIRDQRWGARTLDIDILFYGSECLQESGLCIPHPELVHRRFVLKPLAEIMPTFVHPEAGLTINEIYGQLQDSLKVEIFEKHTHC